MRFKAHGKWKRSLRELRTRGVVFKKLLDVLSSWDRIKFFIKIVVEVFRGSGYRRTDLVANLNKTLSVDS